MEGYKGTDSLCRKSPIMPVPLRKRQETQEVLSYETDKETASDACHS